MADLLRQTMESTDATNFRITEGEEPDEADGVVTAWFTFETAVGRGSGLLRLNDEGAWTLPDHARRAQGPRGEPGHHPAQGRRARRPQGPGHLEGAARRRGRGPRPRPRPLRRGDRRRAGRHRARGAAAPARRRPRRRRPARAARRPVAQPVQVAVPARPRLVRPPALPAVPAQLAGLRAEGQDRRLARDVHAGHGDQLLGLHDRQERHLGRREEGVDGHRRPRRRGGRAAPQAARLRPRRVGQAEHPDIARPGRLPRRAAPQLAAPRPGRLQGQAGRRHRLEQLGVRHLRGAVGGRRRRDDGAAQLHPHRQVGLADGDRPRRPLLRAGRSRPG